MTYRPIIALEEWIGPAILKYRILTIVISLIVLFSAAFGAKNLTFDNNLRVFFSKENPQMIAFEFQEATYTKNDNIMFAIAPQDGNVFTKKTLAAIVDLTEGSWKIPFSSRVDSLTNFQNTYADEDDLIVESLVEDVESLSDDDLARIRDIALKEPLLLNRQISAKGHVAGINITIVKPEKSFNESGTVTEFTRKIVKEFELKYPDISLYTSGSIIIDNSFREATERDIGSLFPLMYLCLTVIIWLAIRSITGAFATLMIIGFSVATALGMAGWAGIALSPPSAISPTIILTLAVADGVHILVTIYQRLAMGDDKNAAICEAMRVNLQPVFLTSLTTTIGFLTMNFSDAPPFRDLGNIVAVGVIAAFFYSIFTLPAIMSFMPMKVRSKGESRLKMGAFADFVISRKRPLFWGMLTVALILTAGVLKIEMNDNFVQYFDETYQFRLDTDFIQDELTGFDYIEYSLASKEPGGINTPEYQQLVEDFSIWYKQQPKVVRINNITDTFKKLNRSMHGDDETFYALPESRELSAQYLLLYELSLPFGLDLNNTVNVDKSSTRLVATLRDVTSREIRNTDERARQWLKDNAPKSMFTYGTGLSIMFAHISKRNIESMLGGSALALVLISTLMILALRSFKLGILSLVPNLLPAFMGFGLWGLLVGRVGLALSVIAAMTIGIVVDDTVHFMSKYLRARRESGATPEDAVRYSFNTVGVALTVTTFALVAGFMILSTSGFKVNSEMGLLTAITITLALIIDFLFLPALLLKVDK